MGLPGRGPPGQGTPHTVTRTPGRGREGRQTGEAQGPGQAARLEHGVWTSPPPASKLGVPCRMTKCRKSGEAFIFTVPDRSPLRNCTYLQRTAAQGSHGGPHGSELTRGHMRRETEPAVLGRWEGTQPHWRHPGRAPPPSLTLANTARARDPVRIPGHPQLHVAGHLVQNCGSCAGSAPTPQAPLCPQPRAMRAQATGLSQCPQSHTGSGHRAITVPPTHRGRRESEGEDL